MNGTTMLKLQAISLGIIYVLIVGVNTKAAHTELQVSLTTLKSDLDLILDDFSSPRTVNIKYGEGAVLHALIFPKIGGAGGRYVKIEGSLNLQQKKKASKPVDGLVYEDGSFGIPFAEEPTTYIVIKPDPLADIKSADKTLTYVPIAELTTSLNAAIENMGKTETQFPYTWPNYQLGTSYTKLAYTPADGRLVFSQPLKGISLHRGNKLNMDFQALVRPETYKSMAGLGDKLSVNFRQLTKPGNFKSLKRILTPNRSKEGMLTGISHQILAKKHPDVFFDVWYEPRTKRYGSSCGSFAGVDAVRIYDERTHDLPSDMPVERTVEGSRAEYIRERIFEQDIYAAYMKLNNPDEAYQNVILNYANEIVLEVKRSDHGSGDRRFVTGSGTTNADPSGSGPLNLRASYDLNQLQYSVVPAEGNFVPTTYQQQSWYLKYADWNTFGRHLKAIWAAMQGGCTRMAKMAYKFNIFYGEGIRVKYDCQTQIIELQDVISLLTDVPKFHKSTTTRCDNLKYLPSQQVQVLCLGSGDPPIAIRQEPKTLYSRYEEPVTINSEILMADMVKVQEALLKTGKSRQKPPTRGAILLDEKLLLDMKLPNGQTNLGYVEVYSFFTGGNHAMLKFHGGYFSTQAGFLIPFSEISVSTNYLGIGPQVTKDYVLGSKYVTIKQLQLDLKKVSEEALKRCAARVFTSFSFKIVHHRQFGLRGYYDCSERVFLFEGEMKALIKSNAPSSTQIGAFRLVDGFIYVEKDNFFITERDSFEDVYAISVPEMTASEASAKSYGAPIEIDTHTYVVFKSKDV